MSGVTQERAPAAFGLDDPCLNIDPVASEPLTAGQTVPALEPRGRRRGWTSIFLSAVTGLVFLGLLLWVQDTVAKLLARSDWLGWTATVLFAIAGLAFFMMLAREVAALLRLTAITSMRARSLSR